MIKRGKDDTQPQRQRYLCKSCGFNFDDLTDTIFAGHHQPLRQWIGCLYLMRLNLLSEQIAAELDLDKDDVYAMTMQLRSGIVCRQREVKLSAEVECGEMYLNAGHKGKRESVKKRSLRAAAPSQRGSGQRYSRKREAADLWHD
ncbi:MAG: transposase [Cyanobacteria bacterium CAN_BIN43]|nr:transposase [Cyanobacteria bacterium CAN_BIN43]